MDNVFSVIIELVLIAYLTALLFIGADERNIVFCGVMYLGAVIRHGFASMEDKTR